ncbi:hypothetical protein HOC96_04765 [archaeon]|jgi:hypothetical protein|nr:hypothetical protein [archaeon]
MDNQEDQHIIQSGTAPYDISLRKIQPFEGSDLGTRYNISVSPFEYKPGAVKLSIDNFSSGNKSWRQLIRGQGRSPAIFRAHARDAEDISHTSRVFGRNTLEDQYLISASNFTMSMINYFRAAKINARTIGRGLAWEILPGEDTTSHPLNQYAALLYSKGVKQVQIGSTLGGGAFLPKENIVCISAKAMVAEDPEWTVGTIYHEGIHAVMHNLESYGDELKPFRSKRRNKAYANHWDTYKGYLSFDEILAHCVTVLFDSFRPTSPEEDHFSINLMNDIIKNSDFDELILSQYNFQDHIFSNNRKGFSGECRGSIYLGKSIEAQDPDGEARVTIKIGSSTETSFAFPKILGEDIKGTQKLDQEINLIDLNTNNPGLAQRILQEVKSQTRDHNVAASKARDFMQTLDSLDRPKVESDKKLYDEIYNRFQIMHEVPGITALTKHIEDLDDACKKLYLQFLQE